MGLWSEQIDETWLRRQCAKVPQYSPWHEDFFDAYLGGNCVPVPTPSTPDKPIPAFPVKSPLNKGKSWHLTADQQTLGLRLFAVRIAPPLETW